MWGDSPLSDAVHAHITLIKHGDSMSIHEPAFLDYYNTGEVHGSSPRV